MKRLLILLAALAIAVTTTACNDDFDTPSFAQVEAQVEAE